MLNGVKEVDMNNTKTRKCYKCDKMFITGKTGIVKKISGKKYDVCDVCAGIERDSLGRWWEADETESVYVNINTDEKFTVKREDAFKRY
jgi:hypothetical protein